MKFQQYGDNSGSLVVYFHGTPGAITECSLFDDYAKQHKLNIICFDRFAIDSAIRGRDYYQAIANTIKDKAKDKQFDFIGFSIGCHVAIEVSNLLGEQIDNLHLVSAAAPLDSGDYLPDMAGGAVFKLAMNYPFIFRALSYWQSLLAQISPKLLFAMLFASARGEDKKLSQQQDFKDYINPVLASVYTCQLNGYLRDVSQYVSPWTESLKLCPAKTHLWHGSDDNWSPLPMAEYLAENISSCSKVNTLGGASHYSCLFNAAEKISTQLGNKI
ncbi:alpha/beta fold hydrolase [Colwellia psychrerythraea]|uniref:AB hydrolase-1 domain-containing protein n=1 Tax=Colwellia psychrerythraea TaxID=28229 RepID=A0A099KP99_COLPS|nr:alpha/beta hydrolase [Colwellia psychrerythraea]KGJ91737.1 hypothetical protein GAB14E_3219 [Colwellia psychrerythraea]